jgi:hypothetical protein
MENLPISSEIKKYKFDIDISDKFFGYQNGVAR